ncbi:TPA: hypothetical protein ACHR18_003000, partial [Listeria monocytogenes]
INNLPLNMRYTLSLLLLSIFLTDNIISTLKTLKLNTNLSKLHMIADEIKEKMSEKLSLKSKSMQSSEEESQIRILATKIDELNQNFNDISKQSKEVVKRIFIAFPNITSKLHKEILIELKAINKTNINKNKKLKHRGN